MMSKSVLGRGLGSLIPHTKSLVAEVLPGARQEVAEVPVESIQPNPRQPRVHFSASELEDLLNSIKEHGILMPLVLTKTARGFELIAGERRLRAAKMLGLKTVPAVVRSATEQEKLELALIENIQRQDLNALEEAFAYRALIDEFNLKQEEVAKRTGKSRSAIANTLRLLDLPDSIQAALREGKITKSHARTLLAESDPKKQHILFEAMLRGEVTVRAAEYAVSAHKRRAPGARRVDPNISAHEKRLEEILGTKVEIRERGGKGAITLHFYSKDDLLDLLHRLTD
jgi:ParB family chromosome partitioning protein